MTQGGSAFLKNQMLINDDQALKGDLEQMSKDELKERLIVAEMVMKKLFQRNKELEEGGLKGNLSQRNTEVNSRFTMQNFMDTEDGAFPNNTTGDQCQNCSKLRQQQLDQEVKLQEKINDLEAKMNQNNTFMGKEEQQNYQDFMKQRLEETLNEAKRHFNNYVKIRNQFNRFMESRMNQNSGMGSKGQKIQNDIISNMKRNLELQEEMLIEERRAQEKGYKKIESSLDKKNEVIEKKDSEIVKLNEEIDRRKFLEIQVQKYVKGLIRQNDKCKTFISSLSENESTLSLQISEFLQHLNNTNLEESEGESTENEHEDSEDLVSNNDI